ncbi:hypothetical protein NFI96_002474 [Prochilodus magdalenae]|nr:hypothetical protein NFI96_002474 [Prochilodus magdalenae]
MPAAICAREVAHLVLLGQVPFKGRGGGINAVAPELAHARAFQDPSSLRYHYSRAAEQCWPHTKDTPQDPLPASGPPQLKLLCGADFLETFKVPGLWRAEHLEEVVGRFGLVCVSRGGLQLEQAVHESDLLYKHRHNIFLVREWIRNEISATEVRRALRRGLSVKYLLPDSVISYIKEHNLYTQDSELKNKDATLRPLTKQTGLD